MMKRIRQAIRRKIETWKFQWKCSRMRRRNFGAVPYSECLNANYTSSLDGLIVNSLPYPKEVIELYHSYYSVDGNGVESVYPTFFEFINDLDISFAIVFDEKSEIASYFPNDNTDKVETNLLDVIVPNNQNDLIIKYIDNDELVQIKVYNFDIYESYLKKFTIRVNSGLMEDIPAKSMFDIWMINTLEELTRYEEIYRTKITQ